AVGHGRARTDGGDAPQQRQRGVGLAGGEVEDARRGVGDVVGVAGARVAGRSEVGRARRRRRGGVEGDIEAAAGIADVARRVGGVGGVAVGVVGGGGGRGVGGVARAGGA